MHHLGGMFTKPRNHAGKEKETYDNATNSASGSTPPRDETERSSAPETTTNIYRGSASNSYEPLRGSETGDGRSSRGSHRSKGQSHTNPESDSLSKRFIILLGLSGTGKSSFIRAVTGSQDVHVNDRLSAKLSKEIAIYPVTIGDHTFELVEPPAFDISAGGDWHQALVAFFNWVLRPEVKDFDIAGILYFHRISDDRMSASSVRALRLLQALCGDEYMKNVRLITTYWDLVSDEIGRSRLEELEQNYWRKMILNHAQTMRFNKDDRDAGNKILQSFTVDHKEIELKIQNELDKKKMPWEETEAGNIIRSEQEKAVLSRVKELEKRITESLKIAETVPEPQKRKLISDIQVLKDQLEKIHMGATWGGDLSQTVTGVADSRQSQVPSKLSFTRRAQTYNSQRKMWNTVTSMVGHVIQKFRRKPSSHNAKPYETQPHMVAIGLTGNKPYNPFPLKDTLSQSLPSRPFLTRRNQSLEALYMGRGYQHTGQHPHHPAVTSANEEAELNDRSHHRSPKPPSTGFAASSQNATGAQTVPTRARTSDWHVS